MHRLHHLLTPCLTGLALVTCASTALAYDFDESCAPTTLHDSETTRPDTLIMLDNSCSMSGGAGNGQTKMEVSQDVIGELADAVAKTGPCTATDQSGCDDVFLGVGWFSIEAGVDVVPGDDTGTAIKNAVNDYPLKCQTQHGAAARAIFNSNELATSDRLGVAIIVTDGAPYQGGGYGSTKDTVEETLHYLCASRLRPTPTLSFMVGFGNGTNVEMNDLFSAAGGSGKCCFGSGCTYQPGELWDPCVALPPRNSSQLNVDSYYVAAAAGQLKCEGSIQANSGQELKDELLDLLNEAACTFPLDIPTDYLRFPSADEDPNATRVEFDHTILGSDIRVQPLDPGNPNAFYDYLVIQRGIDPAIAAPYIGEGWTFADPFRRTITLTDKLCQEVLSDNVEITETQVACLCPNTGSACDVPCVDGNSDGYDDSNGALCEDDGLGNMIQAGRCQYGTVVCEIGVERCAPDFSLQPDICNGIDDDCDGIADNSSRANPAHNTSDPNDSPGTDAFEWNGNESQLTSRGLDKGLFCGYQDFSCGCDIAGPHELNDQLDECVPNLGNDFCADHEWKRFLDSTATQTDRCVCNAGLELEEPVTPASSHSPDEPSSDAAGCQTAPTSPVIPGSLLLFIGMFAAFFKRRKH